MLLLEQMRYITVVSVYNKEMITFMIREVLLTVRT